MKNKLASEKDVIHYMEYQNGDNVNKHVIIEHDFRKEGVFNQRTIIFETDDYDEARDTLDQVRELEW